MQCHIRFSVEHIGIHLHKQHFVFLVLWLDGEICTEIPNLLLYKKTNTMFDAVHIQCILFLS